MVEYGKTKISTSLPVDNDVRAAELVIAAAQLSSIKGDIKGNIKRHIAVIELAAKEGVEVLVFPELSLTGYEPDLADSLALTLEDQKMVVFQELADKHHMVILVGAPVKLTNEKPQIGLFIADPNKPLTSYAKMHLHLGEEDFFSVGDENRLLSINKETLGLAICADTSRASHAQFYGKVNASVYVTSMLITAGGYDKDTDMLQQYAKRHKMAIVMSNHVAITGGWQPIGKSAIWDEKGKLIISGNENEDSLVIGEKHENNWCGRVVTL